MNGNGNVEAAIFKKLDELRDGQAALQRDVAALKARVDAKLGQHEAEVRALFSARTNLTDRVGAIERDYVPRPVHEKHCDENRQEHHQFREKIADLSGARSKAVGVAIVLGMIGSAALGWLMRL